MDTHLTPFEQAAQPRRHASQATVIEQSRAVAEVQAAVVVAQQRPRDKARALQEMREVSQIPALAERAFFRFSRGGGNVTGESIHLARELARCWGNIDYGAKELSRDDDRGISEMLAFAWDLETNARSETTFIVPHLRDTKGGPKRLTDMRDIYENNANSAARRLRECIFSVLPVWFREEAADICRKTLEDGGGKPLVQRIADCIAAFEGIAVSRSQLEERVGRLGTSWLAEDVASLGVVFKSIKRGEVSKEEEFPRIEGRDPIAPAGATAFEAAAHGQQQAPAEPDKPKPAARKPKAAAEATAQQPAADDTRNDQPSGGGMGDLPPLLDRQNPNNIAARTAAGQAPDEWESELDRLLAEARVCKTIRQYSAWAEDNQDSIAALRKARPTLAESWDAELAKLMDALRASPQGK